MRSVLIVVAVLWFSVVAFSGEQGNCPLCQGSGNRTTTCNECRGQGQVKCPKCSVGRRSTGGVITCPTCEGAGVVRDSFGSRQTCNHCKGAKAFRCPDCEQGWVKCGACKGQKTISAACSRCNGGGKLLLPSDPKLAPIDPESKAALQLEAKRTELKLQIIRLTEQIEQARKDLATIEAQLAQPLPPKTDADKKVVAP